MFVGFVVCLCYVSNVFKLNLQNRCTFCETTEQLSCYTAIMLDTLELSVLTLNVWGIPFVSSDRETRIAAISTELNSGKYDIVSLQEVWSQDDCQSLKEKTQAILPYAHYFYSGVIGAGLLVLSKYPIIGALFHAWSVNGYFHRVQHADWFGGKGVGLCRILINDHIVHLYNAHLHAEYDNENDEYKTHRVIQAFDTAQFIEATRGNAVLQILAGDLNTQPQDISYKMLLYTSKMQDCCDTHEFPATVATNECNRNSYTSKHALAKNPLGIRIDHIFVRSADNVQVSVMDFILPFPDRVPGHKFSFSDHEAVLANLKVKINETPIVDEEFCTVPMAPRSPVDENASIQNGASDRSQAQDNCRNSRCCKENITNRIAILHESISLCEASLQKLKFDRILYYSIAIFLTFLLIALAEYTMQSGFKTLYLLLKFTVFGVILFSVFMGSIWNYIERNGILSGKMSMETMLHSVEKFELGTH